MDKILQIILEFRDMASTGVNQSISGIQNAVKGLQTGVSKAFSGLSNIVGGSIDKITGFVSNLASHMRWASLFIGTAVATIGSSFVNMAAGLEQTRVGFETLLKDEAKVRDALTFIQKWALETPFSVTEATDSFKRFLAVTGDLDLTKKYLQNLGDAVVATSGNINEFNFAARAMTQIQAMSKVRAQEMYQLVNANIPAFDILARAIQDGKLKVEGLNVSMSGTASVSKKLTSEYKKASGNIGEMNDRLAISKQRLKEAEANAKIKQSTLMSLRNTVQNYEQSIAKANGAINEYNTKTAQSSKVISTQKMSLDQIKGELQDIGQLNISGAEAAKIFSEYFEQAYGGAAARATTSLRGQLGVLKDQIVFAASALLGYNQIEGKRYGLYKQIGDALRILNKFLKDHTGQMEQLGKVMENNLVTFGFLGMAFGIFVGFITGILAPVAIAAGKFGALGIVVGVLIEKNGGLKKTVNDLKTAYENIKVAVNDVTEWVKKHKSQLETVANIIVVTLLPSISSLVLKLGTELVMAIGKTTVELIKFVVQLGIAVIRSWLMVAALIAKTIQLGIATVAFAIYTVGVFAYNVAIGIATVATWAFNTALAILTSPITLIVVAIGILIAIIIFLITHWDLVKQKASEVWENIKKTIGDKIEEIKTSVGGLITSIRTKFEGLVSDASSWGSNLVKNFVSGMVSKALQAGKKGLFGPLGTIGAGAIEAISKSGFQHGGIVPGPVGAPVPAIVHGGERIIPRGGESRGAGGIAITINMNGQIAMDSPQRVKELANEIKRLLSRDNELAHYGLNVSFV